ncbi:MAG: RNA polymerase sigma factor RpoH [Halomonas sp.]
MTNQLVPSHLLAPAGTGSLDAYIQEVNRLPVLSLDEEQDLARRFRDEEDLDAARRMVMAHLRFVVHVARGYAGYGLALGDLIQEGNIGLMKAVKRFDPDQGVRLVSFAVHWIRAEIHEFILRNWRIVKVATTKAQRKLFFNLRSAKRRLGWFSHEEVEHVAGDLGVTPREVLEMESRLAGQDMSFDPAPQDDETHLPAPAESLADQEDDPAQALERADWDHYHQDRLHQALGQLDERSRAILARRWLAEEKSTLQDLAAEYGISAERVRQLERNAIGRLRQSMAA